MPRSKQLFYIASELEEDRQPTRFIRIRRR